MRSWTVRRRDVAVGTTRRPDGIVKEVDLADAKIVRRAPVTIHLVEHLGRERTFGLGRSFFILAFGRNCGRQAHIEDESGRIAKPIEVLAEGLSSIVLLNADGEFGGGHIECSFPFLRNL